MVVEDWGLIGYSAAWERQKHYQLEIQKGSRDSTLVLCQHPTVITIGRNGSMNNVLLPAEQAHIPVIPINRGGDVTLHNPGQLVGYPIFRLTDYREDLHWFLREIEECIIRTIALFGIAGGRVEGLTGVWIDAMRKVCAIGIHCSRWVTSHGFALNISNNLDEFRHIIPCGIPDRAVTSMARELQSEPSFAEVQHVCVEMFTQSFR